MSFKQMFFEHWPKDHLFGFFLHKFGVVGEGLISDHCRHRIATFAMCLPHNDLTCLIAATRLPQLISGCHQTATQLPSNCLKGI
jgi:hypothetical protein